MKKILLAILVVSALSGSLIYLGQRNRLQTIVEQTKDKGKQAAKIDNAIINGTFEQLRSPGAASQSEQQAMMGWQIVSEATTSVSPDSVSVHADNNAYLGQGSIAIESPGRGGIKQCVKEHLKPRSGQPVVFQAYVFPVEGKVRIALLDTSGQELSAHTTEKQNQWEQVILSESEHEVSCVRFVAESDHARWNLDEVVLSTYLGSTAGSSGFEEGSDTLSQSCREKDAVNDYVSCITGGKETTLKEKTIEELVFPYTLYYQGKEISDRGLRLDQQQRQLAIRLYVTPDIYRNDSLRTRIVNTVNNDFPRDGVEKSLHMNGDVRQWLPTQETRCLVVTYWTQQRIFLPDEYCEGNEFMVFFSSDLNDDGFALNRAIVSSTSDWAFRFVFRHEVGHLFGAPDSDFVEVLPTSRTGTGHYQSGTVFDDIMYGTRIHQFRDYSREIINHTPGFGGANWRIYDYQVRQLFFSDPNGNRITDGVVTVYVARQIRPHFSGVLEETPIIVSRRLSADGSLELPGRFFHDNTLTALIEIESGGRAYYGWFDILESSLATFHGESSFTVSLRPLNRPELGRIQGLKVRYPDNDARAFENAVVTLDDVITSTHQPFNFQNLPAGNHKIAITVPSGWAAAYSVCPPNTTSEQSPGCHDRLTNGNEASINVPGNGFVDIWWHLYRPGVIQGVRILLPEHETTGPHAQAAVRLDGQIQPQERDGIFTFPSVLLGRHRLSVQASSYNVSYTVCYGNTTCHDEGHALSGNTIDLEVAEGQLVDVHFYFTPRQSGTPSPPVPSPSIFPSPSISLFPSLFPSPTRGSGTVDTLTGEIATYFRGDTIAELQMIILKGQKGGVNRHSVHFVRITDPVSGQFYPFEYTANSRDQNDVYLLEAYALLRANVNDRKTGVNRILVCSPGQIVEYFSRAACEIQSLPGTARIAVVVHPDTVPSGIVEPSVSPGVTATPTIRPTPTPLPDAFPRLVSPTSGPAFAVSQGGVTLEQGATLTPGSTITVRFSGEDDDMVRWMPVAFQRRGEARWSTLGGMDCWSASCQFEETMRLPGTLEPGEYVLVGSILDHPDPNPGQHFGITGAYLVNPAGGNQCDPSYCQTEALRFTFHVPQTPSGTPGEPTLTPTPTRILPPTEEVITVPEWCPHIPSVVRDENDVPVGPRDCRNSSVWRPPSASLTVDQAGVRLSWSASPARASGPVAYRLAILYDDDEGTGKTWKGYPDIIQVPSGVREVLYTDPLPSPIRLLYARIRAIYREPARDQTPRDPVGNEMDACFCRSDYVQSNTIPL